MLNKNLFRSAIARAGMTQDSLAAAIGISGNTLSAKILGRSYFDTEEIDKICDVLSIVDNDEKVNIFLSQSSQNRDVLGKQKEETKNERTENL